MEFMQAARHMVIGGDEANAFDATLANKIGRLIGIAHCAARHVIKDNLAIILLNFFADVVLVLLIVDAAEVVAPFLFGE